MLATQEEFESRNSNSSFKSFRELYLQAFDPAATLDADHPNLDYFVFEEYVRHTHAQRIFDWIVGDVQNLPQASEFAGLLHAAPEPFRHYLALICKSHHLNNLHDRSIYPLDMKFGNSNLDTANIQFLAIALRLADILHMSRDRTPSIEFRLISPKNPVSAREWAKQLQVSGVGPSATDPSEIVVHGVCNDPRLYFYLKNFIRICDAELTSCRAWLESTPPAISSRYFVDARNVSDAGLQAHGFIAERFELELDHRRVIDLLMGHSLYGDQKVAIRELMQNSIDAVRVRRRENPSESGVIHFYFKPDRRELTITDNGIGMDLTVIRNHFLKIGDSYYRSLAFKKRCPGYTSISQFGIGFLSAFMIADRVTISTWATGNAKPLFLELEDIYDLFTVRELSETSPEAQLVARRGTSITLRLREGITINNLVEEVRQWLVFLEFPIKVQVGDAEPVEVYGITGSAPDEIASDIMSRAHEDQSEYVPILLEREDIVFVILWPGGRLGNTPVLEPVGRYILPITEQVKSWWYVSEHFRKGGRREPEPPIRKVANSGVYLSNDVPGLKISERVRLHYVVDCRGETRFTPLVSRAGIALDNSSVNIVSILVETLVEFISSNVRSLLDQGVSKYFCSYYASQLLSLLFDRNRLETEKEKILSVLLALAFARRVAFVLVKNDAELVLRSFDDQAGKPIVLGRNVYDRMLRSVSFGVVDFPLPREVLDSLPENYVLSTGAEDVLAPLILLSKYQPTRVLYDENARGVFVECQEDATPAIFGSRPLLDFPHELHDVVAIHFKLIVCLNSRSSVIGALQALVDSMCEKYPNADRSKVEEQCVELVIQRHERGLPDEEPSEFKRYFLHRLRDTGIGDVTLSDDLLKLMTEARVIRDDLWSHRD
ncbi:MAG TPA: ATP-binding protein [Pyrinomonadaceae bacterium]